MLLRLKFPLFKNAIIFIFCETYISLFIVIPLKEVFALLFCTMLTPDCPIKNLDSSTVVIRALVLNYCFALIKQIKCIISASPRLNVLVNECILLLSRWLVICSMLLKLQFVFRRLQKRIKI